MPADLLQHGLDDVWTALANGRLIAKIKYRVTAMAARDPVMNAGAASLLQALSDLNLR